MTKETKTEKETKELLRILGENPTTRFINFFIGLTIVSAVGSGIFYLTVDKTVGVKDRRRSCVKVQKSYLKTYFSKEEISKSFKEKYDDCQKILGSSFAIDSKKYCEKAFSERFLLLGPKAGEKRKAGFDKIIQNCGNLVRDEVLPTVLAVKDKANVYDLKAREHMERLKNEDNKAIRLEMESWLELRDSYLERLELLKEIQNRSEN
ncbi:MAG: hypothetical protein CME70_14905 [Halobacteriovorax sp.]|nr:hypothetical protein [Halobacteriovorax sp.]|tara:strand:+ start:149869 stop:150489 length:621 start_codon:yes stop_codon:yes gene_type:complete